jgi:signal peptidase I
MRPAVALAIVAALTVLTYGWVWRRRVLLVTVDGPSMLPTYKSGDRLLVRRVRIGAIRRGSVVVAVKPGPAAPDGQRELIVKRAAAVPGDPVPSGIPVDGRVVPDGRLVLLGDNPVGSYDSRVVGYFDSAVGVVVRRIR